MCIYDSRQTKLLETMDILSHSIYFLSLLGIWNFIWAETIILNERMQITQPQSYLMLTRCVAAIISSKIYQLKKICLHFYIWKFCKKIARLIFGQRSFVRKFIVRNINCLKICLSENKFVYSTCFP